MAQSDHGHALFSPPSQPYDKSLHTVSTTLSPGQQEKLPAAAGAPQSKGLERSGHPGLQHLQAGSGPTTPSGRGGSGCLSRIFPPGRQDWYSGRRRGTTTPSNLTARTSGSQSPTGRKPLRPGQEAGGSFSKKKGGGKGCGANLSFRHHERGFCCEAVHFQNDRGQRTGYESTSHG